MAEAGRRNIPVLIVEDNRERQDILKNLFRDHAWILVNTAERAIRLVKAYTFEIICLDYDLAGPGNGEDVARAVLETKSKKTYILIHSMNGPGADKIKAILPESVCVPINQMIRSNAAFKNLREQIGFVPNINWKAVFQHRNSG